MSKPKLTLAQRRQQMEDEARADLEKTEVGRALLAQVDADRPARADVMSSSPGRERCVYCGRSEYEPGWGCHACGMAAPRYW